MGAEILSMLEPFAEKAVAAMASDVAAAFEKLAPGTLKPAPTSGAEVAVATNLSAALPIAQRWFHDKNVRNIFNDPDRIYCSQFTTDVIRATPIPLLGTIDADTINPAMEDAAIAADAGDWIAAARNWIQRQVPQA